MSEDTARQPAISRPALAGRHGVAASMQGTDPVAAAALLRAALSDHGITSRIKPVDTDTALLIAGEQIVLYHDGCFWWPTGRFREGRTITGIHTAADPAGAARRLARHRPG